VPALKKCQIFESYLYLITPPNIREENLSEFAEVLEEIVDKEIISCLQIRLKDPGGIAVSDDIIRTVSNTLLPIVQSNNVAFIMNDNPELASELGCDGVHIGQEDITYSKARSIMGDQAIIGVTCHNSKHLAITASELGADYVAFGAFFPTETKTPKTTAQPELLKWWSEITQVPCVAIGGINPQNCLFLMQSGADFLAVSSGVWNHPAGHAEAISEFEKKLKKKN
tara:strand:+ start:641 stop:1318 length:678 start_codon:yes stop_codon:yes gene_type:complete